MAYPYIPAKYHGGRQDTWDRVVIHGTVSSTYCGGARAIARYFQDPSYVSSAHYCVDPCEVIQCVYDHTVAYHAPPNTGSIGIELCDPVDAPAGRWDDRQHRAMLALAAEVTRKRCAQKDVPLVKRNGAELRAGKRGICGHDDVRDAWGQTSHWDPGPGFPWEYFIALVREEEDDMPSAKDVAHELLHGVRFDDPTRYPKGSGRPASADDITVADALQRLLEESYGRDNVPVPATGYSDAYRQQNPNFTGPNAAGHMWADTSAMRPLVKRIAETVGAPVEVDAEAIADEVFAAFPVDQLADLIVRKLPEEQAQRFVHELAQRLAQ